MDMHSRARVQRVAIIIGLFTAIVSCVGDVSAISNSRDFFPLTVGRYIIYRVSQEVYATAQQTPSISNWEEKDEISRLVSDSAGIATYLVIRSSRTTSKGYWQKVKEYTVKKYPEMIVTNVDNRPVISMVYPISKGVTWNGNSFNTNGPAPFSYDQINQPATINTKVFKQVLMVIERNDTSIINRYISTKQYALGIGLVADELTALELCQTTDCIGSGKIESGIRTSRQIVEFGDL